MSNENKFKATMLILATAYDKTLTPEQVKIYWAVLGSCNPDYLHRAAFQHIENSEWFPRASALKAIVSGYEERDRQHQEIVKASHRIEKAPPTEEQKAKVRAMIKELKA